MRRCWPTIFLLEMFGIVRRFLFPGHRFFRLMPSPRPTSPRWMSGCLIAAGIYNLAWGALTVLWMIVGVYGIGYLVSARDPARHWPIVLVGFLGKVFGPLGYVMGVLDGTVPAAFGVTLPTNDFIWWIPFAAILWHAARVHAREANEASVRPAQATGAEAASH
jgi:uncharacterized membrane protein HdeD (DUF308 family)